MPLTALDIYKLLPKTNCKECGFPTCLAFAMQLATKKVALEKCPYVTEETKAALEGASAPPIRLVTIGTGETKLEIGNETVMYRHEETFYHPTGIGVMVSDNLSEAQLKERIAYINSLSLERIGQLLRVNLIALKNDSGDPVKFAAATRTATENSNLPLILMSENAQAMSEALKISAERKPLLYAAEESNYQDMAQIAKEYSVPLAVRASNLDELAALTPKITQLGVADLVLDLSAPDPKTALVNLTQIRRLALRKTFRPLGFPTIAFCNTSDLYQAVSLASTYISKCAGIVVLDVAQAWQILPLLVLRQNIFTDPRAPIQAEPKVYEIGPVDSNSPLMVTTNFSLTYFIVSGDIEASRIPSYLLVVDSEGLSVMTAWAADKFTPEKIAEAMDKNKVSDLVSHRKLIIPGGVAVMKGKLEELTNWEIIVGPQDSASIPAFMKAKWQS